MKQILRLLLIFTVVKTISKPLSQEHSFVVLICSYNNEKWVNRNLESVFCQEYQHYRIIYINDCSTDQTEKAVKKYFRSQKKTVPFHYLRNNFRHYKLFNLYYAIHALCANHEIIIELDGDDWFLNRSVLQKLNEIYQNKQVWMTYGGFKTWPRSYNYLKTVQIPNEIVLENRFRQFFQQGYIFMALRSFYAGLFKKIKLCDLKEDGLFFTTASDIATMIPMFEMAGERFYHITEPLYLYNTATGINDFRRDTGGQKRISHIVAELPAYQPLSEAPF